MRSISAAELRTQKTTGDLMLLYGETGVGKSVTTLQTCALPVNYMLTEPRDPKKFIIAAQREELWEPGNANFVFYDGFLDSIDYLCTHEFGNDRTIVLDSKTHLMLNLLQEITGDAYDDRLADPKKRADAIAKALTNQVKSSQEDYGALSGQMRRFSNALARHSQEGRTVISLCRLQENPKYDRTVMAGPALTGKEFAKDMPGWYDFIGIVTTRKDDAGNVVYPPCVTFEKSGSHMAKWTGITPKGGVTNKILDIQKILAVAHGEGVSVGKEVEQ